MLLRLSALLVLPALAVLTVGAVAWYNSRGPLAPGEHRYAVEYDVALLLAPTVLIYLLALPWVWWRLRTASARTLSLFSAGTFVLSVIGLVIALGPLYLLIGRFNPTLADRAFFLVFPFAPVLFAITIAVHIAKRHLPRPHH